MVNRIFVLFAILLMAALAACQSVAPSAPQPENEMDTPAPTEESTPNAEEVASPEADENGAPVVAWTREGGIAGVCDGLLIYADGRAEIQDCEQNALGDATLGADAMAQLEAWREQYASFDVEWGTDGKNPDNMIVIFSFEGNGNETPDLSTQQSMQQEVGRMLTSMR